MSNKFPIEITATDKTGKVFASVAKSGEKLNKRLKGLTGLSSLGQAFGKSGSGTSKVIGAGSRAIGALGSGNLMQFAGAPGLALGGVAALIGSLSALALSTATRATSLKNLTARTGVGAGSLQELQNAGKALNIDEGTTTSALSGFASTVHEASYGYPSEARDAFLRAGIKFRKMPDGSPDVQQAFKDYADFVQRQPSATTRAKVADRVGLGDLLPLLQGGSPGVESAIKAGREARPPLTPEELKRATDADAKKAKVEMLLKSAGDKVGMGVIDAIDDYSQHPSDMVPFSYYVRKFREKQARDEQQQKANAANTPPSEFDASRDWLTGQPAAASAPGAAASQPANSQATKDAVRDGMLEALREGTLKVETPHKRPPGPPMRADYTGRPW